MGENNNMKNKQKYNYLKLNTWMNALEITARFLEPT